MDNVDIEVTSRYIAISFILGCMGIGFLMGGSTIFGIILIVSALIPIGILIYITKKEDDEQTVKRFNTTIANQYAKFESGTLVVKARDKALKDVIGIEQIMIQHINYKPAELVYTSVSIGGVTTGGFHVNEASARAEGKSGSGKYWLLYTGSTDEKSNVIFRVSLTRELAAKAKKSEISKYLQGNTLVLLNEPDSIESSIAQNMFERSQKEGDVSTAYFASQKLSYANCLNSMECSRIKSWLCDEY